MKKLLLTAFILLLISCLALAACNDADSIVASDTASINNLKTETEEAFRSLPFVSEFSIDNEKSEISIEVDNEVSTIDISNITMACTFSISSTNEEPLTVLALNEGLNVFSLEVTNGETSIVYSLTIIRNAKADTDDPIAAHIHTYSDEWSSDATDHWHAATCGHDTVADKSAHIWDNGIITTPATETIEGIITYTCSICSTMKTENVGTLAHTHSYSDGWAYDEIHHWHEATCGHNVVSEKTAHIWNDGEITTPPTENTEGVKTYTCTICKAQKTEIVPIPTFQVSFDLNGGTSDSFIPSKTITGLHSEDFFFDVVKEGFNFRGWQCDGVQVFDENGVLRNSITLSPEMVFYAIFSNTIKLTVISNIPEAGNYSSGGEYAYNTRIDLSAEPKQGYLFLGWIYQEAFLSKQKLYSYQMWDKDVTIEARFALDSFELSLNSAQATQGLIGINPNASENAYSKTQTQNCNYKSTAVIAAYTLTNARFLGWFDEKDELVTTNAVYTLQMPNHDYALTAKWDYYTISYNLTEGIQNEQNPTWYSSDMGSVALFPPTRNGETFRRWLYQGEQIERIDTSWAKDITLTAEWCILTEYTGNETDVIVEDWVTTIAASAFANRTDLKSVVIPSTVKKIEYAAFSGCSALESITIPFVGETAEESPKTRYAFTNLFGDTSYPNGECITVEYKTYRYIPSSLRNVTVIAGDIPYRAFYNCSMLASVTLENEVISIESEAFIGCTSLNFIRLSESITIIQDYAFSGCAGLQSLALPESITSIGKYAFANCTGLKTLSIPSRVKEIGLSAFKGCSGLTSVIFAENSQLESIDSDVFRGCGSITTMTIPFIQHPFGYLFGQYSYTGSIEVKQHYYKESTGELTEVAYRIPTMLRGITLLGDNIIQYAFENCSMLTSITISNNVTSIGESAFRSCTGLTSITIPGSVTSIGSYALFGCSSLHSITIPNNVTAIEKRTFDGCSDLTEITIPSSVTHIGEYAFRGCSNLTSITITSSDISIDAHAFSSCENLTDVTLGSGVKSIGDGAFSHCSALTSITIPNSVKSIGDSAFKYCFGLTSIIVEEGNSVYHSTENCLIETGTKELIAACKNSIIPTDNTVTRIGNSAFIGCSGLSSITIPNSVTSIGKYAFQECSGLTSFNFAEDSQLTNIGEFAFSWCSSLTEITIPNSVKSIGDSAFKNCFGLTSFSFAEDSQLANIGEFAFSWCSNLTEITIPNSVKSIGRYAFNDCTSLSSVTIPNSITSIGESEFSGCSGLTSITIPDSVTSIGDGAFSHCSALTSITIPNGVMSIGKYAFRECSSLTEITIPNSVKSIGDSAFTHCSGLTSFSFAEDSQLTSIGFRVFEYCSGLISLSIPNQVVSIASNAFYNCSSLTTISIPSQVKRIGDCAFYNCSSLTTISIPSQVKSITSNAFYNCSSLTTISIPNSVTSIGDCAFYKCSSLTEINFQGTKNQWNAISKESQWNYYTGIYTVHYTDGDI